MNSAPPGSAGCRLDSCAPGHMLNAPRNLVLENLSTKLPAPTSPASNPSRSTAALTGDKQVPKVASPSRGRSVPAPRLNCRIGRLAAESLQGANIDHLNPAIDGIGGMGRFLLRRRTFPQRTLTQPIIPRGDEEKTSREAPNLCTSAATAQTSCRR